MSEPTPVEGTDIHEGPARAAREAATETSSQVELRRPGRLDVGALVDEGAAVGPDVPPKTSEA
jgi:hypothetical protein